MGLFPTNANSYPYSEMSNGQSYKGSTMVNYGSRVTILGILELDTPLES